MGLIGKVDTPTDCCYPTVVVPKRNEKVRICEDFIQLNKAILSENQPVPTTEQTFGKQTGARVIKTWRKQLFLETKTFVWWPGLNRQIGPNYAISQVYGTESKSKRAHDTKCSSRQTLAGGRHWHLLRQEKTLSDLRGLFFKLHWDQLLDVSHCPMESSKLWSWQLWTQFMQLRIEAWKIQDFNGVWTCDLATPVRRSNELSYFNSSETF